MKGPVSITDGQVGEESRTSLVVEEFRHAALDEHSSVLQQGVRIAARRRLAHQIDEELDEALAEQQLLLEPRLSALLGVAVGHGSFRRLGLIFRLLERQRRQRLQVQLQSLRPLLYHECLRRSHFEAFPMACFGRELQTGVEYIERFNPGRRDGKNTSRKPSTRPAMKVASGRFCTGTKAVPASAAFFASFLARFSKDRHFSSIRSSMCLSSCRANPHCLNNSGPTNQHSPPLGKKYTQPNSTKAVDLPLSNPPFPCPFLAAQQADKQVMQRQPFNCHSDHIRTATRTRQLTKISTVTQFLRTRGSATQGGSHTSRRPGERECHNCSWTIRRTCLDTSSFSRL